MRIAICNIKGEEFKKIQHEEYIKCCQKHGWKIYPKYWTDEYRKKCSDRMKRYWTDERRQKCSERVKLYWQQQKKLSK